MASPSEPLQNSLARTAVRFTPQSLSSEEKAQVLTNLGFTGEASGGGAISLPGKAWLSLTATEAGEVGNPARPFSSIQDAYDDGAYYFILTPGENYGTLTLDEIHYVLTLDGPGGVTIAGDELQATLLHKVGIGLAISNNVELVGDGTVTVTGGCDAGDFSNVRVSNTVCTGTMTLRNCQIAIGVYAAIVVIEGGAVSDMPSFTATDTIQCNNIDVSNCILTAPTVNLRQCITAGATVNAFGAEGLAAPDPENGGNGGTVAAYHCTGEMTINAWGGNGYTYSGEDPPFGGIGGNGGFVSLNYSSASVSAGRGVCGNVEGGEVFSDPGIVSGTFSNITAYGAPGEDLTGIHASILNGYFVE